MSVVKPSKLAHIVLRTNDKGRLIEWWQTVFGMEVVHDAGPLAFLTYDDEHHRLAVLEVPDAGANDRSTVGLEHVAFTYANLDDLLATYERLAAAGITPIWPIHHGMTMSLYYADPDGNQVELQVDVMDAQQANDFMSSDVFAANPIGVPIDPDDLVARRRAGASIEELTTYVPA